MNKDLLFCVDQKNKCEQVSNLVTSWTNRVVQKIDLQFSDNIGELSIDKPMSFRLNKITIAVCK